MKMALRVLTCLVLFASASFADEHMQNSERFGQVRISSSSDDPDNTVLWFTEDGTFGSLAKDPAFGDVLAAAVKVDAYVQAVREDENDCSYIAGEMVRFGQSIQSDAEIETPTPVWLGGEGKGAALAYAIYAQRPQDFLGLVGLNFCPDVSFLPKLCQDGQLKTSDDGKHIVKPAAPLDHSFLSLKNECKEQTGFGALLPKQKLTDVFATHVAEGGDDDGFHLGSLSLIPIDSGDNVKGRILFFSGDGGWAALDKQVSEALSKGGYEVYGVDCLRYFWKSKDPKEAATELKALLKELHDDDPHLPVYLAGYSFGADILPHIAAALDAEAQNWVKSLFLVNPEQSALFEIHITEWLGVDNDEDEIPTVPVAVGLTKLKPYCICSEETEEPLCTAANACQATKMMPGDHHFNGDFNGVAQVILGWLKKK